MRRPIIDDQTMRRRLTNYCASSDLSLRRVVLIFFIAIVLVFLVVSQLLKPVQEKISERYLMRGDQFFLVLNYEKAEKEYQKSLEYNTNNEKAKSALSMVRLASVDIAQARSFFQEKGNEKIVSQIDLATADYSTAKEALAVGLAFYQNGEWALGQYPLIKAVSLDSQYPEAWHYLGLVYEQLSVFNATYQEKSKEAFKRRDELTPEYIVNSLQDFDLVR